MEEINQELDLIELKISELSNLNKSLLNKIKYLEDLLLKNENQLILKEKENKELEEQNRRLKTVNAFSGSNEHKKLMKLQMNRMIKEIDTCIAELKNTN